MINGGPKTHPQFNGACRLCFRYKTFCGKAALVLVDEDAKIRHVCPNGEKVYGYSRDELIGMSAIRFVSTENQLKILQELKHRFYSDDDLTYIPLKIIAKNDDVIPIISVNRTIVLRKSGYIAAYFKPEPSRYIHESPKVFIDALKAWHDWLFGNCCQINKYVGYPYSIQITDLDLHIHVDPENHLWRIGQSASNSPGYELDSRRWLPFWRGKADLLSSSEKNRSADYMTSLLSRFKKAAYLDHVLEDAGISTQPLTPAPSPREYQRYKCKN